MKRNIINSDVLSTYLSEHRGTIALLTLIIQLLEQIRDLLEGGQQQQSPQPFSLEDYKHLNLTDEQIRKAIVRLREDGKLNKKENWVSVHKVLCWVGVITDEHGTYSGCESYLKELFPADPRLSNLQDNLRQKYNGEPYLKKDLAKWLTDSRLLRYGELLPLAQRFLELLREDS